MHYLADLYDEVAFPSSIHCSLLHHSHHTTLIICHSLHVLLTLSHDTTILLSQAVRDLETGKRETEREYSYFIYTRRGREGERERKRGTYSAGLFCCGELSSMWKDLQTRANSKAMERGRHLVNGCGQWVWSHTYMGTQRTRAIFNVKTLMVVLK